MKFKNLARKGCAVFLALALCMSLVQVPAFAAELEGGETPSVSEPAAPEANETTSPVDKAPADNGEASAPEAPKQDATEEKEETTPVETPEEETNEETNSEEPNDEDATDNETPEEDAEAEDAEEETPEEETPEDAAEEDAADSETPEEETEEDVTEEEITDEDGTIDQEEVLDEEPTEEVTYSEAAQKFLDAVAGLPDSVTKENFESISALLDKVQALFGALTEEEMALVDPVLVKVSNLMESIEEMGTLLEEDESVVEVKNADELNNALTNNTVTTIKLVADIVGNFTIGRSVNLDLGTATLSSETGNTIDISASLNGTPIQVALNGGTITSKSGAGVFVRESSKLIMDGTTIENTASNGVVLQGKNTTSAGASFQMNSGKITGSKSSGVFVGADATFDMAGGEISNNTVTENNAKEVFKLNNKAETIWYRAGGGVYVNGGTFNMTGGTITKNSTGDLETKAVIDGTTTERDDYVGRGGGVAVMNGGTFNLSGNGIISNNEAGEAGGVMIGQTTKKSTKDDSTNADSVFTMTGGIVDGNVAHKGEGGGIYIKGEGHISAGQITDNTTYTATELGGGGIYVENSGKLDLINAIITANTAANFGGGIAACVHGKTLMFSTNGAGIFENVAEGDGSTTGNAKVDGSAAWSQFGAKELAAGAMDIFSAGNSSVKDWTTDQTGTPGALIGLIMLGGEMANWAGWKINFDSYTDTSGAKFTEVKDPTAAIHGDQLLGLTSNASDKAIAAAWAAANAATGGGVLISGNYSAMDGGGIANNGLLTIGAESTKETENAPELDLTKTLENVEDREEATSLQEGEFSFNLVDDEGNTVETMTNTANGKWTYDFKGYSEKFNTAEDGTTFKFTVSEDQSDKADNIDYDLTTYEVTIKVSVKEISADVGGNVYTVITRLLTPTIVKVTDKNGAPVNETVSVLDFVNTYTAPETDNPPDEEKPPVDPVDPPEKPPVDPPEKPEEKPEEKPPVEETPEEPPVDVPDEEPPLVDIPEEPPVDIPDEEPPLVEIPDEQPPLVEIPEPDVPRAPATPVVEVPDPEVPLVDIPEEDVPLADVPATGDNSGLWMVLGLVACAGLAYFFLDEKKRQNEAK